MSSKAIHSEDLEIVAALVEGSLSPEETKDALKRVDEDPALYELFVETAWLRREMEEAEEPAPELPQPQFKARLRVLLPIAAIAASVLLVAYFWLAIGSPQRGRVPIQLAITPEVLHLLEDQDWYESPLDPSRGVGGPVDSNVGSIEMGMMVVDLDVAIRAGSVEDALILLHRLREKAGRLRTPGATAAVLADLLGAVEAESPSRSVLGDAWQRLDDSLKRHPDVELDAYRLGRWLEIGRLAAMSDDRQLLASKTYREQLVRLRESPSLSTSVRMVLGELQKILVGEPRAIDLSSFREVLRQVFESIERDMA